MTSFSRCGLIVCTGNGGRCELFFRSGFPDAADGRGFEGIVGPGVLGVAPAELLADFEVGAAPEAAKVGSQLDGFVAGG